MYFSLSVHSICVSWGRLHGSYFIFIRGDNHGKISCKFPAIMGKLMILLTHTRKDTFKVFNLRQFFNF